MKNILLMMTIWNLLLGELAYSQDFYDINTINTLEIQFEESTWDELLDNLVAEGNEARLMGTAYINGVRYDSVGVRYKGNSSYSPQRVKNPLNVKLDYIIDNQKHEGYGTLRLANVFKDPSFVRETLSYEIAGTYFPASKANYIKVYINDTYLGLYTSVQDVDKLFLKNHFYSKNNAFFKGEITNESPQTVVKVWGYWGSDSANYTNYYELKSNSGWGELINFLDLLNNNSESVAEELNIDRHLWMLAFDNLLVNLDSPINFAHNFYLYRDDNGRFNPIIWDLNESFGGFSSLVGGRPLGTTDLQQLSPYLNAMNSSYPIISKILANSTYKKMYIAHMKTIMTDYFESGRYKSRALEIQSIIDEEVQNDANKFYTYSDFSNNIDNSVSGQTGGPPGQVQSIIGLSELMEPRLSYLNSLTEFQTISPTISEQAIFPAMPAANTDIWVTARVEDAVTTQLFYRNGPTDLFVSIPMLDDGNHNDGTAGDGIYGVSIPIGTNSIEYYFYAENNDAASFLPEQASYHFYTIVVAGDLVINEFMASNSTTVADEAGEFDDWIELYNNSDNNIQLGGYFLSDDANSLTQWIFPDTFIVAHDYLIVWADKDEEQKGLHANFKLSASGEAIYLTDSDTTLINEVTFTEQATDLSTGRFPNGTGAFKLMNPTFADRNLDDSTRLEEDFNPVPEGYKLQQNYPNPFNSTTTIRFSIPMSGLVSLKIYNITGQLLTTLVDRQLEQGSHTFIWQAENLASGIYFCRLQAGSFSQTNRMILIK